MPRATTEHKTALGPRSFPREAVAVFGFKSGALFVKIQLSIQGVDEVLKLTNNRQEPFVYGSLSGDVISLAATK